MQGIPGRLNYCISNLQRKEQDKGANSAFRLKKGQEFRGAWITVYKTYIERSKRKKQIMSFAWKNAMNSGEFELLYIKFTKNGARERSKLCVSLDFFKNQEDFNFLQFQLSFFVFTYETVIWNHLNVTSSSVCKIPDSNPRNAGPEASAMESSAL